MADIAKQLTKQFGDRLLVNEPMSRHTTFKIGGPADYFFAARTADELAKAASTARQFGIPLFVFGGGSNLLVGDRGIRGLVVRNLTMHIGIKAMKVATHGDVQQKIVFVEADSGVPINKLVRFTLDEGLAGLQMHLGLPGSVGGAVYMNSKWTHPEGYVGDAVYQVRLVNALGEDIVVPQSYFHFAYDTSRLQKTKDTVISVIFSLSAGDKELLWNIADESIGYRRKTQPQGVFSAGCTFRNLSKADAITVSTPNLTTSAGYLVDHAGLKNMSVGDAYISPIHANFIINRGKATASDVVKLIELARETVLQKFGVRLTEEIERVGDF